MKRYKINGLEYEIIELSQEEMKGIQNKRKNREEEDIKSIDTRYFGLTYSDELRIIIDKDLAKERKRRTLMHELCHCYINACVTHQDKSYDEEFVCDIVSNSHDIIQEIVEDYFKERKDIDKRVKK